MAQEVIDTHYRRLAGRYDDFLYYSPEFVRTLTSKMIDMLELEKSDTLVDLGCGTAMYSLDILKQLPLDSEIIGVDPYPEMLANIPVGSGVRPLEADALSFSKAPGVYDKILIKETIHHIPETEALFGNLHERLGDGGILLLVHVPPNVEYPLFEKALERCRDWHANPDDLEAGLDAAGFEVERDELRYTHSIPKEKYFEMVENRYMSALTSLSDSEVEQGLEEMEEEYKETDILRFVDHFDYLKAVKK